MQRLRLSQDQVSFREILRVWVPALIVIVSNYMDILALIKGQNNARGLARDKTRESLKLSFSKD